MKKSHGLGTIIISIAILTLLIIPVCRSFYSSQAAEAQSNQSFQTYIVHPGDTYWSIARQYVKGDPREFIYNIIKLNNIAPEDLRPGQRLKIPER